MLIPPFPATFDAAIELAHQHQLGSINARAPTELLICLSADGNHVIDATIGIMDRVELTVKMRDVAATQPGCRLVHNHPKEGSLSAADWFLGLGNPCILEIVVVNSQKSIFRGTPLHNQQGAFTKLVKDTDLSTQVAKDVFEPLWTEFRQGLAQLIETESPEQLQQESDWVWSHLVNERFQWKGYVNYSFRLSQTDANALLDPRFSSILQRGRDKIEQAIP